MLYRCTIPFALVALLLAAMSWQGRDRSAREGSRRTADQPSSAAPSTRRGHSGGTRERRAEAPRPAMSASGSDRQAGLARARQLFLRTLLAASADHGPPQEVDSRARQPPRQDELEPDRVEPSRPGSDLEETWRAETDDPVWSAELREYMRETIAGVDARDLDVRCRTTLRFVQLTVESMAAGQTLLDLSSRPDQPLRIARVDRAQRGLRAGVFVARPEDP